MGAETIISSYGIGLDLPPGWEGRIFRYEPEADALVFPIVHAGSFSFPPDENSLGDGAIRRMHGRGAFFALVEYEPGMAGDAGFSRVGLPLPIAEPHLRPEALNAPSRGLLGFQSLFQLTGRPFAIQLAIGAGGDVEGDLSAVNAVLGSLTVDRSDWTGR